MSTVPTDALPRVAQVKPCYRELKKGDVVWWCACGRSRTQPYCDGSHKGTGFQPLRYEAKEDEEVLFCGCKRSGDKPHCDGSHNSLVERYGTDDAQTPANRAIAHVERQPDGKARIDGGCFVCSVGMRPVGRRGTVTWSSVIDAADGARHQAQFHLDFAPGESPPIAFGERHVALLVVEGAGELDIAGRRFPVEPVMGAYAKPGETFRMRNPGSTPIRVFASVGPTTAAPEWPAAQSANFDGSHPERTVRMDPGERQAMAERFFQMLVDRRHGSALLTQFIGEIPKSKAQPHRHLYEESLIVISGEGMMWTETRKATVRAGDVIFLPRKQLHSLECTSDAPMLVAGVICPGANPAINYYD